MCRLLPAWTFGLWLTTSFLTSYDEKTVSGFLQGMQDRNCPVRVFHLDCFWMKQYEWSGSLNPSLIVKKTLTPLLIGARSHLTPRTSQTQKRILKTSNASMASRSACGVCSILPALLERKLLDIERDSQPIYISAIPDFPGSCTGGIPDQT